LAENEWLSVADISEKVGIPVETIRRYIRSHGVHMKVKKIHKRYVIHNESVTVFKQIRELYADGKNVEEVEQTLSSRGIPLTVTVKNDDDKPMTVNVADELQQIKQALEEQSKASEEQKEFNKLLLERLEQQDRYIKESLESRDRALMESIRSFQEEKQARIEVAASVEKEEKKKGFFSRLFGG
jgi:DNA-binding transcriptional MerR regulator